MKEPGMQSLMVQATLQSFRQEWPGFYVAQHQSDNSAVAAMRAEVARLEAQNEQLQQQLSEQAYRHTAAEVSPQCQY